MRVFLLSLMLVASLALPAEAAQVVTKDGRHLDGILRVEAVGLVITSADGVATTVGYDEVQAISLDGEPAQPTPHGAEQSRYLNNDVLVWTAVGANLATIALAIAMLVRGNH